ncbi:hypothetical protein SPBR_00519 [Sporothrix brasiliensis 5110]|uniref:Major facilitator superfamily (MFS) profile domain-containing protein n=1 Tax=Sporothrix brasiliensis 5110 TaxID=1398154 RepID=A0A0C2ISW7_9PEZI|nr:uncharacterized protein SPBR_00519 [Sporothrix brasiliensis 5110]KIH89950.1 hypothetical protein SPBR_00519 [Sporothrix brasiliensis 5110]
MHTPDTKPDPVVMVESANAKEEALDSELFSPEEERRFSYDKGIMSAATQFDFNADLGLTTIVGYTETGTPITNNQKYANASMMFYVGYLIGTYPQMYLTQRFGVTRVISLSVLAWGAIVMATSACSNYAGIMVARLFLGIMEAAVAPAFTVLVTFWWTREEQALRTSLWYSCVGMATMLSPLINYGIGHGVHGALHEPWKYMFLIVGAVTVAWSFVLAVFLPDTPLNCARLRDDEKALAVRRLARNNAGTVSRQFNAAQFREAFLDYKTYSSALIILLTGVPSGAIGTFGTIVINGFGFDHFASLALTSPIGAITALSILLAGYVTRRWLGLRHVIIVALALVSITGTLFCWFGPRSNRGFLFAGVFLLAVQVAAGGQAVSLAASNTSGHTKKATVSASTFLGYCIGNIIGPLIFGASPGPLYHAGFLGSFICLVCVVVIAIVAYILLRLENRRRDRLAMAGGVRRHTIDEDLTDKQNEDFRYVL